MNLIKLKTFGSACSEQKCIENSVINATLIREPEYTRKKSTISEAEAIFLTIISKITPDGLIPTFNVKNANQRKHWFNTKARSEVKKDMSVESNEKW